MFCDEDFAGAEEEEEDWSQSFNDGQQNSSLNEDSSSQNVPFGIVSGGFLHIVRKHSLAV